MIKIPHCLGILNRSIIKTLYPENSIKYAIKICNFVQCEISEEATQSTIVLNEKSTLQKSSQMSADFASRGLQLKVLEHE